MIGSKIELRDALGILSLIAVVVSGSIWLGALSSRVSGIEQVLQDRKDQSERLARVEVTVEQVKGTLIEINSDLRGRNNR